jgi:hypothetical protein
VALLTLGVVTTTHAENDPCAEGIGHFEKGIKLGGQKGYSAALAEFETTYALCPEFTVLYNIAQAHVALRHPRQAIETLQQYLRDGGDNLPAGRREKVMAQIERLMVQLSRGFSVASGMLAVSCPDPGLKARLDDMNVDAALLSAGVPVAAGSHELIVSGANRRFTTKTIEIPEGARVIVICEDLIVSKPAGERPRTLLPIDGPPTLPLVGARASQHDHAPVYRGGAALPASPRVYALAIGGIALGGAALGVYLWNKSRYDGWQATDAALRSEIETPDRDRRQISNNVRATSIDRVSKIDIGLTIAAGASVATSVAFWISERSSHRKTATGRKPVAAASFGDLAFEWRGGSAAELRWSTGW